MKYILSIFVLLLLIITGGYFYTRTHKVSFPTDYKNATYTIEGQSVTLANGTGTIADNSGSSSKTTVTYFGNEVTSDMDNDGTKDIAFLVTESTGGSGTFYYLAFAHGKTIGYQGANMVFIGDRISPQTTEYKDGQIIVNYADRTKTDPMSVTPSVGVSKYFTVTNGLLVEKTK